MHAELLTDGTDAGFSTLSSVVNDPVEQDDFLIVFVPQRWHPINRTEKFGEKLGCQLSHKYLLLAGNDRRRLGLTGLGQQFLPFEESRNVTLPDGHVFHVQSPDDGAAHLSTV